MPETRTIKNHHPDQAGMPPRLSFQTQEINPAQLRKEIYTMKKYYIANDEHWDAIYGAEPAACIDMAEVERLASEWGITTEELLDQMHEADLDERCAYGTYDA